MSNYTYAAMIILITGAAGVLIGIFEAISRSKKAWGFGSLHAPFPVKDVHTYNQAVGRLWMITGLAIAADGMILYLFPSRKMGIVAVVLAVVIYSIGTGWYVTSIESRFRKK
ncbi:MAG: hypothetical protein SOI44_05110 [Lactimicrobium sp.]|uniref:hypothetical protein n=1 Tax=Lactimicrobium sp. TaxID=2563780 RepID=UPI002F355CFE